MRKKKPLAIPLAGKKHSPSSPRTLIGQWFYARKDTTIRALVVATSQNYIEMENEHTTFKVNLKRFVLEWASEGMKRNPKPLKPRRRFGLGWSKGKIDLNSR